VDTSTNKLAEKSSKKNDEEEIPAANDINEDFEHLS